MMEILAWNAVRRGAATAYYCIIGGAGSSILEFASSQGNQTNIQSLGIPDKFIPHGTQAEQKQISGIDSKTIEKTIRKLL